MSEKDALENWRGSNKPIAEATFESNYESVLIHGVKPFGTVLVSNLRVQQMPDGLALRFDAGFTINILAHEISLHGFFDKNHQPVEICAKF